LSQSFYSSLMKTTEPYGVIFSHPSHIYHPTHMPAFAQPHTPSNATHTQLEPVDLSVSKRSSSTSSSSSPPCSSASSSPASSRSSPPSPYSAASRASPRCSTPHAQLRCSPSHALLPPTPSLPYSAMVGPMLGSGSGVMMSPVMVPLSVLYPSPLHLHQSIMVSPPIPSDDGHHRSREHKTAHCGDAHNLHKQIKTEPRSELAHDLHGGHEVKSSVIRIPHEYG
ncbi:putative protein TPRXL, partial [Anarrhichthys ocellatus]